MFETILTPFMVGIYLGWGVTFYVARPRWMKHAFYAGFKAGRGERL